MSKRDTSGDTSTAATVPADSPEGGLDARIEGAAGIVTLDRPRALNALTSGMRAKLADALAAWGPDPQVYAALIVSASERAFCAGGDVLEMAAVGRRDLDTVCRMMAAEYALNWRLDCFTKPTVALMDGAVMGSGVGITLYGTHRVAGERYRFAMPECGIGLFPDDGVSWALARLPDAIGMYLALTGRSIGRGDAYRLGLVTHCIPAARFGEIRRALAEADPVDPLLDARHEEPDGGDLEPLRETIARSFGAASVAEIVARLEAERGAARAWAEGVLADIGRCSPTSLEVTFRHVREAAGLDLAVTLARDYRLACRFLAGHDFYEGVRAALIDRDRAPQWRPGRLAEVSLATLEAYFAPLERSELQLASRGEMQAVR